MSGGSGYVLSREALRIFAEGQNDTTKCRQEDDHAEDVEMGRCLFNLGVKAGDSRDGQLRNRFYPVAPFVALLSGNMGRPRRPLPTSTSRCATRPTGS